MGSNVLLGSWVGSVNGRGGNLGGWWWFGGISRFLLAYCD